MIPEKIFKQLTGEEMRAAIRPEVIQYSTEVYEEEEGYYYFEGMLSARFPREVLLERSFRLAKHFVSMQMQSTTIIFLKK